MGHAETKRERMEQIELLLQNTRTGLSKREIADKVGCDVATVHRHMEEIKQRRTLIEVEYGRYRLDPSQSLSNVRLYPSEALSVYLALRRFIRQTSHAPDFMINAIQKVAPALQRPDLVETLVQSADRLRQERGVTAEHTDIWQTLLRGWLENIVVRIQYQKPRESKPSEHEIEPYLFEPMVFGHGTYLIAWSRTRDHLRTFKLDRIERATLTMQRFERPSEMDIDQLLEHAWGVWYGVKPTKVELLFVPEVAPRLMENVFHPTEYKELLSDGSLYWSVEVAGTLEVLSWIRGWGPEVKVLSPDSLRQEIIKDLRQTLALYEEVE
jgi:proteasome accessory factor B